MFLLAHYEIKKGELSMLKVFIIIITLVFSISLSFATIIYIPDDYSTIQNGIDNSVSGDTVLIRPGVYHEHINFDGHRLTLGSLYLTTGDTCYISQTIIDGDSAGTVITVDNGVDSMSVIAGLTIRNGFIDLHGPGIFCDSAHIEIHHNFITGNICFGRGGGIFCSYSNALIHDNYISKNKAHFGAGIACDDYSHAHIYDNTINYNLAMMFVLSSQGGAIGCFDHSNPLIENNIMMGNYGRMAGAMSITFYCTPVVINNTITNNTAIRCGAIIFSDSNPFFAYNYIANNTTDSTSAAIFSASSNATIVGNIICENTTTMGDGGAYFCTYSNDTLRNNIIVNNYANSNGGAMYIKGSIPAMINNVVSQNTSNRLGGAAYITHDGFLLVTNSIFWGNHDISGNEIYLHSGNCMIEYSCIQGGWPYGDNIDCNPEFRDPANYDFHLKATYCGDDLTSPCVDLGCPDLWDSLLDCSWGLGELRSDMGAYGGGDSAISDIDAIKHLPDNYEISVYPNPFNAATHISFTLPEAGEVRIDIYDILGRHVANVVNSYLFPGYHSAIWYPEGIGSGQYYLHITHPNLTASQKLLYIK